MVRAARNLVRLATIVLVALSALVGCQPGSRTCPLSHTLTHPLAPAETPQLVPPGVQLPCPMASDPGLRPPRHILALSSGGLYGAFSAGFLSGWTRSGTRPEFDVVTGVSTGALAAPFAFLGLDYDDRLMQLYTNVHPEDVFRVRAWVSIPFTDAVASSAPLQELIDSQINQDLMARVAAEYRRGRRLYISTTNLDSRRQVVWDMGAIATLPCPQGCRLFRDVILASCSVPGMLPPVLFQEMVDGHIVEVLHVDGGVSSQVFMPPHIFRAAAQDMPVGVPVVPGATGNFYAVVAGKLYPDATPVRRRVLPILGATTQSLMYAHCRAELTSLYGQSLLAGMRYHQVSLRQDIMVNAETLISIDQQAMSRLCHEGSQEGLAGPAWHFMPPDICGSDSEYNHVGRPASGSAPVSSRP